MKIFRKAFQAECPVSVGRVTDQFFPGNYFMVRGIEMALSATQTVSILLYGCDARLVETRGWVLQKDGFHVLTSLRFSDLQTMGMEEPIELFLLCDSLDEEARSKALTLIHSSWPRAKRLVLTPISFPAETSPTEEVFHAMEGPGKLLKAIRTLIVKGPAPAC